MPQKKQHKQITRKQQLDRSTTNGKTRALRLHLEESNIVTQNTSSRQLMVEESEEDQANEHYSRQARPNKCNST